MMEMGVVSPKKAASEPSHHHHKLSQDVGKCELQVGGLYDYDQMPLSALGMYSKVFQHMEKKVSQYSKMSFFIFQSSKKSSSNNIFSDLGTSSFFTCKIRINKIGTLGTFLKSGSQGRFFCTFRKYFDNFLRFVNCFHQFLRHLTK